MAKDVIVRFAPSPTGYLHVGSARTAIFNWLYAQKTGGKMILRIEDTDVERNESASIQGIEDGLQWLGITWDKEPYFQSQFTDDHVAAAKTLLETGHAYKCFCTKAELEQKREIARQNKSAMQYDGTCRNLTSKEVSEKEKRHLPYTIRLKVPWEKAGGSVRFRDIVYGDIEKKYEDIEDFVIVRSNGQPLYVLSNAIDDIRDGITHVIRGQDGLANTPKQILIYRALGVPLPRFAHMSLTLDPQKAKISKRKHGELVAIHYYREHGFLPWAFFNFLVLLGWSTPESRQFFTKNELIDAFSLEGINRANSVLNINKDAQGLIADPKALNMNAHYLRHLPLEEIIPHIKTQMIGADIWDPAFDGEKRDWFFQTVDLLRNRYTLTTDFITLGRAFFSDDYPIDEKALKKNILSHPDLKAWFVELADLLETATPFDQSSLELILKDFLEAKGIKPGLLMNGIRTVATGQSVGPGFFEILTLLGKKRVVDRLRNTPQLY